MSNINSINDFMAEIKELYPLSFKEGGYPAWKKACVDYLYNPRVDYSKLFEKAVKFNPNGNFAPDIPWLLEQSKGCYKKEEKKEMQSAWRHPKIFNPIYKTICTTDCFPIGTTDEQIIKTYEKMFPNTTGWRVVYE